LDIVLFQHEVSILRGFFFRVTCFGILAAACGGSSVGGPSSVDGGGGAGGAGMPGACGGMKCEIGRERCAHRTCGAPDSEGYCTSVPLDCLFPADTWEPVCGCDGRVRKFDCGDVDLGPASNCIMFPCGGLDCDIATQYCERQVSDVGGIPDGYACKPLPAACAGAPSCACVRSETCGAMCKGTGSLGMILTCPGG
jgi:hypothetical protein